MKSKTLVELVRENVAMKQLLTRATLLFGLHLEGDPIDLKSARQWIADALVFSHDPR